VTLRRTLVALLLAFSAGCNQALPDPDDAHVAALFQRGERVELGELRRGRALYVVRCSSCHALKEPRRLSPDAWVTAMRKMEADEGVVLERNEALAIERYLVAVASVGD
jgi:mono/diheme cytochrome c family protein